MLSQYHFVYLLFYLYKEHIAGMSNIYIGEGHLGTVVEIGKPGNSNTPDMTVVVQWDSGFRTNYRIGYQGSYDLRIYDNAPTGKSIGVFCVTSVAGRHIGIALVIVVVVVVGGVGGVGVVVGFSG